MNGLKTTSKSTDRQPGESDRTFQAELLEGVSRTFALTLPQLPEPLCHAVSNAYLLCRIADTIEDEVALDPAQKADFCHAFIEVVKSGGNAVEFSQQLAPLLSSQTLPAEHELIQLTPRVIAITRALDPVQQTALAECVETMAEGMPLFQEQTMQHGLKTMADMDRDCYYVAGCVGEMLAKLFCHHSAEIAVHRSELLELSVSFGQGLQMTNILKDIWDDHQRGVCWLPQDIFTAAGFNLDNLATNHNDPAFKDGLKTLLSIAHGHLQNALNYVILLPKEEIGIRYFCLWALGMALLTLRKINANLGFDRSEQVKITRNSVKATIVATRLTGRSDFLLQRLFDLVGRSIKE